MLYAKFKDICVEPYIGNMIFYFIISILLSWLFYQAERNYSSKRFLIYFGLFVIIASVIEGCRDWNVGDDMQGYGIVYWQDAQSYHSVSSFFKDLHTQEYGYHLLNYVCSAIGDINVFLYAAAFIKITLVGLTTIHFRKDMPGWLFIFTYLMVYFFYGFSLMRQTLAMSFCIYSLTALFDKKYIKFTVFVVIGYLFHNSAIFMIVMLPLKLLAEKGAKHIVFIGLGTLVLIYEYAMSLFVLIATSGLFAVEKFDLYEDSGVTSAKTNILTATSIFVLSYFIPKSKENRKILASYIRILAMSTICCLLLSSMFEIAFRISYYFAIPMTLCVLMAFWRTKQYHLSVLCILALHIIHFYFACKHGLGGTIPYKSTILGI